ncbi:metallophosphoesterase [Flavihumibacter sp. R14]|nr:metallophosphoesterase [Flavihumibacter soli]
MRKLNYFPLIVLALFSILLDYYVFGGIKALTREQPGSAIMQSLYWLISIAILFSFLYMLSRVFPSRKFSLIFNISFNSYLTVFVSKLAFAAVLFGEDIYRFLAAGYNLLSHGPGGMPARSVLLSQISLITSSVPFFSFLFGVTVGKYYYRVRRSVIHFEDLPEEFHNFTIVQISDIHAGSFDNPSGVRKGIRLINAQNPDLVVFTGDLVNNKATEIVPYLDMFKEIQAPFGKFSILGNHDYGDYIGWSSPEAKGENLEALKGFHGDMGFRLMMNSSARIFKSNQHITLMGVENWGKGFGERGDLRKALNGVSPDDFKILLSHDPTHWDAQVKNDPHKIHLTLSGHTHGMQFGIEIGKFKWSPAKYRYQNWAGLAESNGRYLYVNRGFGFLGFAGRVGIWPEITVIQLKRTV